MSKLLKQPNFKITKTLITEIKTHIQKARFRSMVVVNRELIKLYWNIGKSISSRAGNDWGKSLIENISKEIQIEYPGMKGFSTRNIWYMVKFFNEYKDHEKLQHLVAEIPWGQNILILDKVKNIKEKEYYLVKCKQNGWSRGVLYDEIKFRSFEKSKNLQHNFDKTINSKKLALYRTQFTDEYNLSFLGLSKEHTESELEELIVENIITVIGRLGTDFAFMGRQFKIEVGEKEFFIDLLFYHRRLKSLSAWVYIISAAVLPVIAQ